MVFTRWYVGFNPLLKYIRKRHMWVVLKGFPIQLWTREVMIDVANLLGKFIYVDDALI